MKQLDGDTLVAGQIAIADLPALKAQGITTIINNRPDGEEPGQPTSAVVEAAAGAAGLSYWHIPVAGGVAPEQVEAMAKALSEAEGKTLAFCRSGTRSAYLWALARSRLGAPADELVGQAAAAGYDLTPIRRFL